MSSDAQSGSDRTTTIALGGVLVILGIVLMVRNLTDFDFGNFNWWALFILIPAAGSLASAWRTYQNEGRLSEAARGPLVVGLMFLLAAAIFLFNLSWGTMWPVFLIIIGLGALIVR
jgi:peptidoglycan/LPS O-acetylase OafA/YrhL